MELRVLRYFLTVAREGNITRAANFLHITQPTLSRQIKDLEEELGQKLLIRGNHNVSLTKEGILLRKRAEEIVDMVNKTQDEFRSMSEVVSGDIYIGGAESKAIKWITKVIKELTLKYPNIHYHLYSGNADDVTERIDKGLLDFGILIQPANIIKYHHLDIPTKDVWGVLMRKDSLLAQKEEIIKEDLLHVPLICSRQAMKKTAATNKYLEWFGEDFYELNIITTFNLVYNAALMVEEGIGYAITIDNLVDTSENSNLCFRPLAPTLASGLRIVWKKYQVFSEAGQVFLAKLKEEMDV